MLAWSARTRCSASSPPRPSRAMPRLIALLRMKPKGRLAHPPPRRLHKPIRPRRPRRNRKPLQPQQGKQEAPKQQGEQEAPRPRQLIAEHASRAHLSTPLASSLGTSSTRESQRATLRRTQPSDTLASLTPPPPASHIATSPTAAATRCCGFGYAGFDVLKAAASFAAPAPSCSRTHSACATPPQPKSAARKQAPACGYSSSAASLGNATSTIHASKLMPRPPAAMHSCLALQPPCTHASPSSRHALTPRPPAAMHSCPHIPTPATPHLHSRTPATSPPHPCTREMAHTIHAPPAPMPCRLLPHRIEE